MNKIKLVVFERIYFEVEQILIFGEIKIERIKWLKKYLYEQSFLFDYKEREYFKILIMMLIRKSINEKKIQNLKDFPVGGKRNEICWDGYDLTRWLSIEFDFLETKLN